MNFILTFDYPVALPELRQVNSQSSDMASWSNTFVSEIDSHPTLGPDSQPGLSVTGQGPTHEVMVGDMNQVVDYMSQQPVAVVDDVEEDVGVRLVHALLMCAEAIQCGEFQLASSLVSEMANELLTRVDLSCGIGKVAGYFTEALSRRLYQYPSLVGFESGLDDSFEVLYHHFYEACPYLKFAHFTANQAILEAFSGHDFVHIVDFNLMHGLQWPALIQALAFRPGGPPALRLTAISQPSTCQPRLEAIGLKLAELAQSVNLRLSFHVVTASRLEDIKQLQTGHGEVVAMNSILQLHRLLGSSIEQVFEWIQNHLNPKIMVVVEQEANHNQAEFLARFTEALHYYSTMFDSLEACHQHEAAKPLAEAYIQTEVCNILCCEGLARVERHEPLANWRARLSQAGFKPLNMGYNALKQANMLLTLFSTEGFSVQESFGCLSLGWHGRPLIAASAWQARSYSDNISATHLDKSSSSSSSSYTQF